MNTRMMKRTNLSRTFPAEILNVSTTAALLSTTGKLLHTIQDRPEEKKFVSLQLLLSKKFTQYRIGLTRFFFPKRLGLKTLSEAFQRKSKEGRCSPVAGASTKLSRHHLLHLSKSRARLGLERSFENFSINFFSNV